MATEYKLSYTASEIDERLKKVDTIPTKVSELENDEKYVNKDYVDNLPDHLTLTDDEKTKWQNMIGATKQISITWAELKQLRDNSELIPGQTYRIIDYECTTSQEETRAVNHQFDIIVQALSADELSENASADFHYVDGVADTSYFYDRNAVEATPALVNWHYTFLSGRYDAGEWDDFVEMAYLENNEGVLTPVLYAAMEDEEGGLIPDMVDQFFYIGEYEHYGVTYDRWIKIETDNGDGEPGYYTWDSEAKKYILTNRAVENNQFIVTDVSEIEEIYEIYDDDTNGVPYQGKPNDIIVSKDYKENSQGVVVPVLYKTDSESYPNEPDYTDTLYYAGRCEYNGVIYDKWEQEPEEDTGTGDICKYILTDIIVENNQFIETENNDSQAQVKKLNLNAWQLKYCLDNDTSRFGWADVESGKGIIYYMKDEWDNECPYDFKNIQFMRSQEWQENNTDFLDRLNKVALDWMYTFTWIGSDCEVQDLTIRQDLADDSQEKDGTHSNKIGIWKDSNGKRILNKNILICADIDDDLFWGCVNNAINSHCHDLTLFNPNNMTCISENSQDIYIDDSYLGGVIYEE